MSSREKYVAEITFLDGTTRTYDYSSIPRSVNRGVVLLQRDNGDSLIVSTRALQTIEVLDALDDD